MGERETRDERPPSRLGEGATGRRPAAAGFELLGSIGARLVAAPRASALVEELCREVMEHLGCEVSMTYLLDEAEPRSERRSERRCERRLRLASHAGLAPADADALSTLALGENVCGRVAESGLRLVVGSGSDPTEPLYRLGLSCFASLPLLEGERLLGTVAFGSRQRQRFDAGELSLMVAFARQLSAALAQPGARDALCAAAAPLHSAEAPLEEARFTALLTDAPVGITLLDPSGRFERVNRAYCELVGYDAEELTAGMDYQTLTHPEDLPANLAAMNAMLAGETSSFHLEKRYLRKDGGIVWARLASRLLRDAAGRTVQILAIAEDITERKRAEEAEQALRVSEGRFRQIAESLPQIVWTARPDGSVDYYNQRWAEFSGIPVSGGQGWGWAPVVHPDDAEATMAAWQRAVTTGGTYEIAHRIRAADGSFRWMLSRGVPLRDSDGRIIGWFGSATDIDDVKRLHAELEAREAMLDAFFAASPGILNLFDEELRYINSDRFTPTYFGLDRSSIVGRSVWELNRPFAEAFLGPMAARVIASREPAINLEVEGPVPSREGELGHWRASYFPVPLPGGGGGLGTIAVEITDIKRAEEALRRSHDELDVRVRERTAALERAHVRLRALSRRVVEVQEAERRAVARELHDEAGQGLTALMLGLGMLQRKIGGDGDNAEAVRSLKALTAQVMEDLHALSVRLRPAALDRLGLGAAVRALAESARDNVAIDVDVGTIESGALPLELEATVYRIVQEALTNIVRHAGASHASVVVSCDSERAVAVVTDDGRGFDPEVARASGRLGLAGMQERAELLGGTLDIETSPGDGTTIRLELPVRP